MGYPVDAKVTREWATILLVDDDPNILRPLQLRVERDGYRVLTAPDWWHFPPLQLRDPVSS